MCVWKLPNPLTQRQYSSVIQVRPLIASSHNVSGSHILTSQALLSQGGGLRVRCVHWTGRLTMWGAWAGVAAFYLWLVYIRKGTLVTGLICKGEKKKTSLVKKCVKKESIQYIHCLQRKTKSKSCRLFLLIGIQILYCFPLLSIKTGTTSG